MGLPLAYSESLAAGHMTIRIYSLNKKKKVVCGVFHIHLEIWIFKSLISPIERCSIIWQTNVTVPCPQHSPKCVTLIKLTLTGISSVYDMYHLNIIKISNLNIWTFLSLLKTDSSNVNFGYLTLKLKNFLSWQIQYNLYV